MPPTERRLKKLGLNTAGMERENENHVMAYGESTGKQTVLPLPSVKPHAGDCSVTKKSTRAQPLRDLKEFRKNCLTLIVSKSCYWH